MGAALSPLAAALVIRGRKVQQASDAIAFVLGDGGCYRYPGGAGR